VVLVRGGPDLLVEALAYVLSFLVGPAVGSLFKLVLFPVIAIPFKLLYRGNPFAACATFEIPAGAVGGWMAIRVFELLGVSAGAVSERSAAPMICCGLGFLVTSIYRVSERGRESLADELGYTLGAFLGLRLAQSFL